MSLELTLPVGCQATRDTDPSNYCRDIEGTYAEIRATGGESPSPRALGFWERDHPIGRAHGPG